MNRFFYDWFLTKCSYRNNRDSVRYKKDFDLLANYGRYLQYFFQVMGLFFLFEDIYLSFF